MLAPKKVKWRKMMKGRVRGAESRGLTLAFGDYGLKSLETCRIDTRALEAARIALTRHIKRGGRVWIRVFPDKPFTKKPAETRMGKGKGSPEGWVACRCRLCVLMLRTDLRKRARLTDKLA